MSTIVDSAKKPGKYTPKYFLNLSKEKYENVRCKYDLRYKVLVWNFATRMQYCKNLFATFVCPDCHRHLS
jgi:hypothetical protein